MTSPDNPFFKVTSGVDRTARTNEPVKYGPVKETHKSKTDFRELLGADERDPETAEALQQSKGKGKSSKKGGQSDSPITRRTQAMDDDEPVHSIFDLPAKQKIKAPKENAKLAQLGEGDAADMIVEAEDIPIGMYGEKDEEESKEEMFKQLAAVDSEDTPPPAPIPMNEEEAALNPSDTFKDLTRQPKEKAEKTDQPIANASTPPKAKHPVREHQFIEERPDLSAIPIQQAQTQQPAAVAPPAKTETPAPARQDLHKLVTQIIDQMHTMKLEDRSESMITLKHPPLFEGARLTLTTYETARGQFNITFDNLTQAAKNILDMGENRTQLMTALEKQGYYVHIFTTTTSTIENPIAATLQQMNQEQEQQGQQQQQQQQFDDDEQ